MPERDAVLFANEAFYRAFADRDVNAMEAAWAADDPVACIHPGWPPLIGRRAVLASWRRILAGSEAPAITCHQAQAFVIGDSAWVICIERIEDQCLAACNWFRREGARWRMVMHQAGPCPMLPPDAIRDDAPPRPN